MGSIIARFRKKKSALDQLEKIDTDIKSIEKFRLNTELAQRKIVGQFILVSAGIYILVAVIFYFYFFPATYYDQLYYITPLLLVPFILWGVKRLLTWYYRRKITRNENKLKDLRTEKKKLLDQVMDTETYKIARTILEKFAPEQLKKSPASYDITPFKPSVSTTNVVSSTTALRLRNIPSARNVVSNIPARTPGGPAYRGLPGLQSSALGTPVRTESNTNGQHESRMSLVRTAPEMSTPLPLPREILPRDRSVLDKMVEYLVGDGPSNRFALICKHCQSHNGMALREEFEYVAFRCCYCFTFNPSRKLRPKAPKLELELLRTPIKKRKDSASADSTSSSERNSDSDLELEEKPSDQLRKNSETFNELPQLEQPVVPEAIEPEPMELETTPEQPGLIRSMVHDCGDKKDE